MTRRKTFMILHVWSCCLNWMPGGGETETVSRSPSSYTHLSSIISHSCRAGKVKSQKVKKLMALLNAIHQPPPYRHSIMRLWQFIKHKHFKIRDAYKISCSWEFLFDYPPSLLFCKTSTVYWQRIHNGVHKRHDTLLQARKPFVAMKACNVHDIEGCCNNLQDGDEACGTKRHVRYRHWRV